MQQRKTNVIDVEVVLLKLLCILDSFWVQLVKILFLLFSTFLLILDIFSDFSSENINKSENNVISYSFDHLLGVRSTQKLNKIHNMQQIKRLKIKNC